MKITIEINVPDTFCEHNIASLKNDIISDIQDRAEQQGYELSDDESDDEARGTLLYIEKYHDCEIGINWYSIDVHIDNVVNARVEETREGLS